MTQPAGTDPLFLAFQLALAGRYSIKEVPTHLGFAAEVSEQVERLIAAQDDVERSLRFPREATPTPA